MHSDLPSLTSRRNARRPAPPAIAAKPVPDPGAERVAQPTPGRTESGQGACRRTAPDWAAPLAKLVSAGAAFAILAGCAELRQQTAEMTGKRQAAENLLAAVGGSAAGSGITASPPAPDHRKQDTSNRHRLPSGLRAAGSVQYAAAETVNLADALATLTDLTGITHLILAGADEQPLAAGPGDMQGSVRGSTAAGLDAAGLGQMFRPEFNDSLPGILDSLASRYGLDWMYQNGNVVFRQFVTRRYQIAALPSQTDYSATIGGANSSGSIAWPAEIRSSLAAIAGGDAVIHYGEGSGFLTVTARPAAQRKVAEYVHELNGFLGDQVAFDINVLTVAHKQSEKHGIDVDLFIGEDGEDHIAWTGPRTLTGAGAVNVGIVSGNVDLSILLSVLSKEGDVTVETRTGATTSNNQMVPIQVVNTTAYAKSVESSAGADGSRGTTINPGTLTTGFEMQLLPRVLADGGILLRYSIKLSDLNDLAEFTSDRQTIQLPKLSTTSFEQQAILGDRETLVLMGFERDRHAFDRPGDSPFALLFGGQSGADSERISTVLTIRPRIVRSDGRGSAAGD